MIELVADSGGRHHINIEINPQRQTAAERLLSADERAELDMLAQRFAAPAQRNPGRLADFVADRNAYIEAPGVPVSAAVTSPSAWVGPS